VCVSRRKKDRRRFLDGKRRVPRTDHAYFCGAWMLVIGLLIIHNKRQPACTRKCIYRKWCNGDVSCYVAPGSVFKFEFQNSVPVAV
jgi:hypothetical protein